MGSQDRYISGRPGLNAIAVIAVIGLCVWVSNCVDFSSDRPTRAAASSPTDTPRLRASAADVVTSAGYWCPTPTSLLPRSMFDLDANQYEFSLTCDDGSRVARYAITMDPDTGVGTVSRS
jgi:hypothetical protein